MEALILGAAFTVVTVKIKTVKKHTRQVLTRISILILSCSVRVSEAFIGQTLAPSSLRRAIAAHGGQEGNFREIFCLRNLIKYEIHKIKK